MKNLPNKAAIAFQNLAKELVATVTVNETSPDFDVIIPKAETVYLWDRKHGMEQVTFPESFLVYDDSLSLGSTILHFSSQGGDTRFSSIGVHNPTEKTLNVYLANMVDVRIWEHEALTQGFYDEIARDSTTTSSFGFSGSL